MKNPQLGTLFLKEDVRLFQKWGTQTNPQFKYPKPRN